MEYTEVFPVERLQAEKDLASNDTEKICNALVAIAFYDNDWEWAQEKCIFFFLNQDYQVSSLAATCLGHVARVHGKIDKDKVIPLLKSRLNEVEIVGFIEDALDDISIFVK